MVHSQMIRVDEIFQVNLPFFFCIIVINCHITVCKFKVYNELIKHNYILQNNYHHSVS